MKQVSQREFISHVKNSVKVFDENTKTVLLRIEFFDSVGKKVGIEETSLFGKKHYFIQE